MLLSPAVVDAGTFSADRRDGLIHLLEHDCGSCHGLTMKGGLGPPLLPGALAEKSDQDLVEIILLGVPGTPMPPWQDQITPEEAAWMVRSLKRGLSR
ncbi:MAG: c-type cytochrome [Rhodospirillales bacterium]